ncbi:hypothetical protein GUITHDRAFT_108453 [Guillardia theta CCMP2712]|uniref:SET domain-containing protein n=1 Tax=Guillardia theta (strain CCMP2712) TaxID=905079 RepID=L1JBV6_GUITC|nr:hypothetical protein GUITHDRAFT_108453 [Guillardia theta CCMP2712]EKX45580.1 hypothetical protein GUITHDRAFT_108453 [Guillardia theta CCMP2712]|eukprot:XP_005832560.1 hypothetical protein GUITHDRAFT_108453 [Guillardia theta CCMP2712]
MEKADIGEVRADVKEVVEEGAVRSVVVTFSLPERIQSASQIEFALKQGGKTGTGKGFMAILKSLEGEAHDEQGSVLSQIGLPYNLDEERAQARFRRRKGQLCVEIPIAIEALEDGLKQLSVNPSDAAHTDEERSINTLKKHRHKDSGGIEKSTLILTEENFSVMSDESRGRHVIASKRMGEGELVWFEEPCAIVKPGMEIEGLPNQSDEWLLTYLLLQHGSDEAWSASYVTDARSAEIESNENVAWIAKEFGCSQKTVLSVFRAVANNAFSLDTALLRVKYGAAFYRAASYFNHSCFPNCFSRRMGGNMAMFTNRPCKQGEELTHSYLPVELLAAPIEVRAANLHFVCECERCRAERRELQSSPLRALGFTKEFSSSELGRCVADFKVTCVASHSKVALPDECELIVSQGNACIDACFSFLRAHPVAALEVVIPYLQALWGGLVAGSATLTAAFASGEASKEKARLRRGARAAASLFQHAARTLREEYGEVVPGPVAKMLQAESSVMLFLLDGSGSENTARDVVEGLRGIHDMHGNSLLVLNEDLSCVDLFEDLTCPSLRQCCSEFLHLRQLSREEVKGRWDRAII